MANLNLIIMCVRNINTPCIHYRCDRGVSQELLGSTKCDELERLPDCQSSSKDCSLSETRGIEV